MWNGSAFTIILESCIFIKVNKIDPVSNALLRLRCFYIYNFKYLQFSVSYFSLHIKDENKRY